MKNPVCIRNLKQFEKSGCPQKTWSADTGKNCPCWIEKIVVYKGEENNEPPRQIIIKQCLDLWMFKLAWDQCGLLEGSQQATESFRNGMVEKGNDGKDYPKTDLGTLGLLTIFQAIQKKQAIIFEHDLKLKGELP